MAEEKALSVQDVNRAVDLELSNPETMKTLVMTTFKGLQPESVRQAMVEGLLRGFTFKDFLEKNIYAIPFKGGYSLITSIDYARKIGMKSGIVGSLPPTYEVDNGAVVSCTMTVKRRTPGDGYIGEFSATVYFAEYYKAGKNDYPSLWDSKPRTMLAKVAEMHALRKACPEELAQSYIEEELEKKDGAPASVSAFDATPFELQLKETTTTAELIKAYGLLPGKAKAVLFDLKEKLKADYAAKGV